MTARLTLRGKDYEVRAGMTVRDAMLHVGLQPESLLATRDGHLITEDEILREGEQIKLVAVISGGTGQVMR
jgi:sulfur carrier protein ThiS